MTDSLGTSRTGPFPKSYNEMAARAYNQTILTQEEVEALKLQVEALKLEVASMKKVVAMLHGYILDLSK